MIFFRLLVAVLCLSFGLTAFSQARAENIEIGSVEEIRLALYGTVSGGDSERLYENDHVFVDELIETVKNSGAQVRFLDDTGLWLGASSQMTLDSFIYDPDRGTGEMVAELGTGLFRFVTGNLPHEGIKIYTPVAVIGIRGTDFSVAVVANGATEVSVFSGRVTVSPRGGGAGQAVSVGETTAVATSDGTVSVSTDGPTTPPASLSSGQGSSAGTAGGGSSSGSGSCFTPDTRVVMADGRLKAIEDIRIGEIVLGHDGALNTVTGVERVRLSDRLLYGFDGGPLFVTAEHPFMTDESWKSIDPSATVAENGNLRVATLEIGDSLVTIRRSDWRPVSLGAAEDAIRHQTLASVRSAAADPGMALYNLLLDGNHAYWIVQSAETPLLQTISATTGATPGADDIAEKAYLVHNKGG